MMTREEFYNKLPKTQMQRETDMMLREIQVRQERMSETTKIEYDRAKKVYDALLGL